MAPSRVFGEGHVGWCYLLLLLFLCIGQSYGIRQRLSAYGLKMGSMYLAYFANGTKTTDIYLEAFPICEYRDGPGTVILEKVDGSKEIGRAMVQEEQGRYEFDTKAHPVLTPEYDGLYRCRAISLGSDTTSTNTYQLHIVVPLLPSAVPQSTHRYDITDVSQSLSCGFTGYFSIGVSWTSSIALTGNTTTHSVKPASTTEGHNRNVSSTFSFMGNDSAIAPGVPFTVQCTAIYTNVSCSDGEEVAASVVTRCQTASKSINSTTIVTAEALCNPLSLAGKNLNQSMLPMTQAGAVVNLACFDDSYRFEGNVSQVSCLPTGQWTLPPHCSAFCAALDLTGNKLNVTAVPGLAIGTIVHLGCVSTNNTLTETVDHIECKQNGKWSEPPSCKNEHKQSASNVEAIVGGTVGGLCGIAFLIFYLVNRSRSSPKGSADDMEIK